MEHSGMIANYPLSLYISIINLKCISLCIMAKKTKPKTPQPQKANETSFKKGDKAAEKWTIELSSELFNNALKLATEGEITLTDIANKLEVYTDVFDYICDKYPIFRTIKKRIMSQIENNTYKGALKGDYVPSIAIFGLKNNHNWKDKTETDITSKGESIKQDISTLTTEELIKRAEATKKLNE